MLVTTVHRQKVLQCETPQEKSALLKSKLEQSYNFICKLFHEVSRSDKITQQNWDDYIQRSEKDLQELEDEQESQTELAESKHGDFDSDEQCSNEKEKSFNTLMNKQLQTQKTSSSNVNALKKSTINRKNVKKSGNAGNHNISPFLAPVFGSLNKKKQNKKERKSSAT